MPVTQEFSGKRHEMELTPLQSELCLQEWTVATERRFPALFEPRNTAGRPSGSR